MPQIAKDETGKRFYRLLVLCKVAKRLSKVKNATTFVCKCDCGNLHIIKGINLRSGVKSCGCLKRETSARLLTTHGHKYHKAYSVWKGIISRCYNPKNNYYSVYGGRGIDVCREWLTPGKFITWACENGFSKSLQIDRIDNDKGYSPENCRFVTNLENQHNKQRVSRVNTSGYAGVSARRDSPGYYTRIQSHTLNNNKTIYLGTYPTPWLACQARNTFIKENNLPHRIQHERKKM